MKSLYCGVCSTDLARRFLPYPLPQIIGHEVVGEQEGKPVVVEINASPLARAIPTNDPFSKNGLHTHSPERITLGIDRLPGGFAPWFLAPVDAIVPVPSAISPIAASLTEPFAAALQGVDATPIKTGDRVAVLGPRRLGMLILSALSGFRKEKGLNFEITALIRHDNLKELCIAMGADNTSLPAQCGDASFDVVFDTTGKQEGFSEALRLAKRCVSLKTTNGQKTLGLAHLTDLVVDELAVLPFKLESLEYTWPSEGPRKNRNVYIAPGVPAHIEEQIRKASDAVLHRMSAEDAAQKIRSGLWPEGSIVPRFDLAVASSLAEVDSIIRPLAGIEFSILRPRGAILFTGSADGELERAIARGIELRSSRCGDFHRTMKLLTEQPWIAKAFEEKMITHKFDLGHIDEAFAAASDSGKSVKVVVAAS